MQLLDYSSYGKCFQMRKMCVFYDTEATSKII